MEILVFDNYDSFTYNLVQIVERIAGKKVDVYRNDRIALEDVKKYDKIILSPGPGLPSGSGLLLPLIREYAPSKSILGVCLGEQAIGESFGAKLENIADVHHGVATSCIQTRHRSALFNGLPEAFPVGRYHSWVVSEESFPETLQVTARDEAGMIMALEHTTYDVKGVQFHPESILTPDGETILRNWLQL
ncbi:anthranilate synthase component II [Haoranjiania flava]|uniref:Aminodeoxychorismate/anthranilate synthase component II n=1 Tax=Haoranjiania flava TaxID=1856322 RepID=A0AAE3IMY7_9BACT|nr:aminodeoxychorismate/anthranilate synthase component II [Haoranjiania flava]MCU7694953.1 aminodeoxychorismate/anthranilate synthase component II [Haoranjiania flava]